MLDLLGHDYVVLTANGGTPDLVDQVEALAAGGFPIRTEPLPGAVLGGGLYAPGEDVVVRPDGVVAARVTPGTAADVDLGALVAAVTR